MQILELSNIDINVGLTLLSSDIEFLDDKTALISLKFDVGIRPADSKSEHQQRTSYFVLRTSYFVLSSLTYWKIKC